MNQKLCWIGAAMLLTFAPHMARAQSDQPLDDKAVIDMVTAKLPKDLIVQKIKSSRADYDISPTALITLNNSKVPKDIIKLMMDEPKGTDTPKPPPPAAPPTPVSAPSPASQAPTDIRSGDAQAPDRADKSVHQAQPQLQPQPPPPVRRPKALLTAIPQESGIYLRATGMPLTALEPNVLSGSKTANGLGSALTYGLSKAKIKGVINGAQASIRTNDESAEFYFVFDKSVASLNSSGQSFGASATSPNEFTLIHLDRKSARREVTSAMVGAGTASSGTDDRQVVPFTFTHLRTGVYRVIPRQSLAPGEYAFFPPSAGGMGTAGAGAVRLFDFGVDP